MSEVERGQVVLRLETWLASGALDFMAEGPTHFDKKFKSLDRLRRHFSGGGRRIYVAADMGVYYPGETAIVPDLLAVVDAGPPQGESWFVEIEGKGLDLALEIHVAGNRRKDVEDNLVKYARLGIREYFIFDFPRRQLLAYRLEGGGYQKVRPKGGGYRSLVLGLDVAVVEGDLCFFQDSAQLLGADDLILRLQGMVDELSVKAEEEMEALRQQVVREQEGRVRELVQALFAILAARELLVPDEVRARILACADAGTLAAWLPRAAVCATAAEILG